jgi:hypothetical protein
MAAAIKPLPPQTRALPVRNNSVKLFNLIVTWPSVEVFGTLENAFDTRYFEIGSTTPGIWGTGGLKFNF